MRALKYLTIALAGLVVLAVSAWLLRDTLIRRISNPMLGEYSLSVTYVSLDALASADATISRLELAHENGTTILIDDLSLPINLSGSRLQTYTAGKVTIITGGETDGAPVEIAHLIDQVLALPDTLAGKEIRIGELSIPPYTPVRDLRWILDEDQQSLRMSFDDSDLSVSVSGTDAPGIEFQVLSGNQRITADLRRNNAGIAISGGGSLELADWVPLASFVRLMPEQVAVNTAPADVKFVVSIPYDLDVSPTLTAAITPSAPMQIDYSGAVGATASLTLQSGSVFSVSATFPEVAWTVDQEQAVLLVSYADWINIPVSVGSVTCRSDQTCSLNTHIEMVDAKLPIGQAGRVELASSQHVSFGADGISLAIQPNARITLADILDSTTHIEGFEAEMVSVGKLEQINEVWTFAADSIDARVQGLSITDELSISAPLFLEAFVTGISDQGLSLDTTLLVPESQLKSTARTIALPGVKGKISLEGDAFAAKVTTTNLLRQASIEATHNLKSGAGRMSMSGGAMSFNRKTLSKRVSPWQQDWNLIDGTVSVDAEADWASPGSTMHLDAKTSVRLENIAGYFSDIAFTGLSTNIEATYNDASGMEIEPSSISVVLVEMGLPVRDISAEFALDADPLAIDVANLRMTMFEGAVRADPFSFRTGEVRNTLTLHAESIELSELLSLKEFEAIEVTGSIGAMLPLTIEGKTVTIADGKLTGDPPGGVIRYLPGRAIATTDASGIGLAMRALSNFEYETLTSDVNYSQDGNLKLQMQIKGRNPDLDESRPVVLNLGVENNVLQMLRSLQAARNVQDILEKRMAQ
jgi:hypothetical protein